MEIEINPHLLPTPKELKNMFNESNIRKNWTTYKQDQEHFTSLLEKRVMVILTNERYIIGKLTRYDPAHSLFMADGFERLFLEQWYADCHFGVFVIPTGTYRVVFDLTVAKETSLLTGLQELSVPEMMTRRNQAKLADQEAAQRKDLLEKAEQEEPTGNEALLKKQKGNKKFAMRVWLNTRRNERKLAMKRCLQKAKDEKETVEDL